MPVSCPGCNPATGLQRWLVITLFQFPQPPRLTNSRHCATLVQRPSSSMQAATQQQKQNGPRVTSPNSKSQASPISAISNRYNKLLEFRVTHTKQTTGTDS